MAAVVVVVLDLYRKGKWRMPPSGRVVTKKDRNGLGKSGRAGSVVGGKWENYGESLASPFLFFLFFFSLWFVCVCVCNCISLTCSFFRVYVCVVEFKCVYVE